MDLNIRITKCKDHYIIPLTKKQHLRFRNISLTFDLQKAGNAYKSSIKF
ncbi:hypothetical protein P278_25610 [Zhouia amylolytica AD3]|uniref:Uncharacterized protein n=1 Tax=Zhouia amylolytica AD3 TaxID=1286632 RepID=W2UKT7_9FLAO|nr:hypothetical protein P278_25610 [Zhouia amylolytica AD3]